MKKIKNYQDFTNEEINLKKALAGAALGAGLAISNPVSSQITTTSVPKAVTKPVTKMDYDSTSHIIGKNVGKLIGQDLYLLTEPRHGEFYSESQGKKINPDFSEIKNKYFKVISVSEDSTNQDFQKSYTNYYILTLEEKETKKKYYFKYDDDYGSRTAQETAGVRYNVSQGYFPFIILGYFEKIRNRFINSTANIKGSSSIIEKNCLVISKNGNQIYINSARTLHVSNNLNDGRKIEGPLDAEYSCIDVSLNESNEIVLIFENEKVKFYITYEDIKGGEAKQPTTSSSGGCLSSEAMVETENGPIKISEIKIGDKIKTKNGESIVKKLHSDTVSNIPVVNMGNFFMTPSHPIFLNGEWIRADEFGQVITRNVGMVYNIELENDDNFLAGGFICASLFTLRINDKEILLSKCVLTEDDFLERRVKYLEVDPGENK